MFWWWWWWCGGGVTSSSVDSSSSLSVKVVVPFHMYCSSKCMSVVVHSSLMCDTSSICVLMACVVLYGSSVDVGGCPGSINRYEDCSSWL